MNPTWEYKELRIPIDDDSASKELNRLGNGGWELITVSPVLQDGNTSTLIYHLRRPAEPERRIGFQT